MHVAKGEFIAIFDADFLPQADFLLRTMHHFTDPKVGVVQARWGHINEDYSLLTRIQSILLDAHFVLEHGGRNRAGHFFNFNGTAGIWRRAAIMTRGGWQHDTLTEDLDLSYRAQLRGWKFHFLPDVVVPAELPVEMNAFKSQQHRWAKGSIQTCTQASAQHPAVGPAVWSQGGGVLPPHGELQLRPDGAALDPHVPGDGHPLQHGMVEMLLIDVPLFFAATASVANFYMVCQREVHPEDWVARLQYLPILMSIGIGLAINNTRAVFEAMAGKQTEFARTPKYRIEDSSDEWIGKRYRQANIVQPIIELVLGLYFTFTVFYALSNRIYGTLPFLVLFQVGFLYTGLLSIVQQFADDSVVLKTQVAGGE